MHGETTLGLASNKRSLPPGPPPGSTMSVTWVELYDTSGDVDLVALSLSPSSTVCSENLGKYHTQITPYSKLRRIMCLGMRAPVIAELRSVRVV